MSELKLIVVIRPETKTQYQDYFGAQANLAVLINTDFGAALEYLQATNQRIDVVVVDNQLAGSAAFIRQIRAAFPRLLILLVDDEADFLMPGRADDVSLNPFEGDDLLNRIQRLLQERHIETLRADSLPPVRKAAQQLRHATDIPGRIAVTLETIRALEYDFVAFYEQADTGDSWQLVNAVGDQEIVTFAPEKQKNRTLIGQVGEHRQNQLVGPEDEPNYSLIKRGRLGCGSAVVVGNTAQVYGVMLAARQAPASVNHEDMMMLELVCAQLAAALTQQ